MNSKFKIVSVVLLLVALIITGTIITDLLLKFIVNNQTQNGIIVTSTNPLEVTNILFTGAIIFSIIALIPILLMLGYKYVQDALYSNEKKIIKKSLAYILLPIFGAGIGIVFTHFVILPILERITISYGIANMFGLGTIIMLYLADALIMAIVFTIPIIIKILSWLNIITRKTLRQGRKYIYLIALILMAIITPTTDVFSLVIMMLPFIFVYELSILWIKRDNLNNYNLNVI